MADEEQPQVEQSGVARAARAGGDGRRTALPGKFPLLLCHSAVGGWEVMQPLSAVQHQVQER